MARIGVQAMMLRDQVREAGVLAVLRRVQEIGFGLVELSQIPLTPGVVDELERARGELGIGIGAVSGSLEPSGSNANPSLLDDLDGVVTAAHRLGSRHVRIGMLPLHQLASADGLDEAAARMEAVALRLADEGLALSYHNHHVDLARRDGRLLLDLIAEAAPHVLLELDVHWLQRGGLDPVSAIRARGDRVRLVHLKDYRVGAVPPEAMDASARGDRAAFEAAWNAVVQFAEVGDGNLDMTGIIRASLDIGAEFLFVEQDELYGRSVWDALTRSHDHLVRLGFGDLLR